MSTELKDAETIPDDEAVARLVVQTAQDSFHMAEANVIAATVMIASAARVIGYEKAVDIVVDGLKECGVIADATFSAPDALPDEAA